jgi:glycosyltransferase involved in cell wall biosynthesis
MWNEAATIKPLVERIDKTLSKEYKYEIIFIDDNSTDRTIEELVSLQKKYPVDFYSKTGAAGKAQSLLEGFEKAKYTVVAMIDGDLQYPPEAIPAMIKELDKGFGVVIADRTDIHVPFLRKLASRTFRHIFGTLLHGFHHDVQSGLKVFRKEIIERVSVHPSPWTFDLEFLLKARDAGYFITGVPIALSPRSNGKTKINLLATTLQLSLNALKLKFSKRDAIPFHIKDVLKKGKGFHYKGQEFIHHSTLEHTNSALYTFSTKHLFIIFLLFGVIIVDLFLDWHTTILIYITPR